MKMDINLTVNVNVDAMREEYNEELPEDEIRELIRNHAETALTAWLEAIGVNLACTHCQDKGSGIAGEDCPVCGVDIPSHANW